MGNVNRKTTRREVAHLRVVARRAFPECELVMGSHSDYGGHRAPRDHTVSFRIRGGDGRFRSNVVWIHPDDILALTPESMLALVQRSNGAWAAARFEAHILTRDDTGRGTGQN